MLLFGGCRWVLWACRHRDDVGSFSFFLSPSSVARIHFHSSFILLQFFSLFFSIFICFRLLQYAYYWLPYTHIIKFHLYYIFKMNIHIAYSRCALMKCWKMKLVERNVLLICFGISFSFFFLLLFLLLIIWIWNGGEQRFFRIKF